MPVGAVDCDKYSVRDTTPRVPWVVCYLRGCGQPSALHCRVHGVCFLIQPCHGRFFSIFCGRCHFHHKMFIRPFAIQWQLPPSPCNSHYGLRHTIAFNYHLHHEIAFKYHLRRIIAFSYHLRRTIAIMLLAMQWPLRPSPYNGHYDLRHTITNTTFASITFVIQWPLRPLPYNGHYVHLDSLCHDVDLDSLCHDVDLDSLCHDVDLDSLSHDVHLDSLCHDVDLDSLCHGVDLDSLCHDVDLDSLCHGVDLDSFCHDRFCVMA